MKKIIVLYGAKDKGKTTTLKKLIEEMRKDSSFSGEILEPYLINLKDDKKITCTYKNKRIAITTGGDSNDIINENLEFFERYKCDILVTAASAGSGAFTRIKDYTKNKDPFWRVHKHVAESSEDTIKEKINNAQAEDLLNCLDETIKELNQNP